MARNVYSEDLAEWRIAKIRAAHLGWEDHGIFTCWLDLDYGHSGQGAGLYALDEYVEELEHRVGTAEGMEFIIRLLKACGVSEWDQLAGRTVYALAGPAKVHSIKPLPTEKGDEFRFDSLWEERKAHA